MTRKPPNSFINWVGGKRQLAGQIISIFAEFGFDSTFGPYPGTYWEPFVGGGAVFIVLQSVFHVVVCQTLMTV